MLSRSDTTVSWAQKSLCAQTTDFFRVNFILSWKKVQLTRVYNQDSQQFKIDSRWKMISEHAQLIHIHTEVNMQKYISSKTECWFLSESFIWGWRQKLLTITQEVLMWLYTNAFLTLKNMYDLLLLELGYLRYLSSTQSITCITAHSTALQPAISRMLLFICQVILMF